MATAPPGVSPSGKYLIVELEAGTYYSQDSQAGFGEVVAVGDDVLVCTVGDKIMYTGAGTRFTDGTAGSTWILVHQDLVNFTYTAPP
jgi:hypothetical protein